MTKRDLEATPWNPWPNRIWPPPITLPAVTTSEITDTMIGLPEDAVAQRRAEQYVRAALSFMAKQEQRATRKAVAIRIALPAQDDETAEIIPDSVEMLSPATSSDRWSN